jgi:hypothetical protein
MVDEEEFHMFVFRYCPVTGQDGLREIHGKNSVKIVDVRAEILTHSPQKTKQQCKIIVQTLNFKGENYWVCLKHSPSS